MLMAVLIRNIMAVLIRNRSSNPTCFTPAVLNASGSTTGSWTATRIPSARARLATLRPMTPKPRMPKRVASSLRSGPAAADVSVEQNCTAQQAEKKSDGRVGDLVGTIVRRMPNADAA